MTPLTFTIFESIRPAMLTKRFTLDADGAIVKTPAAQMVEGRARTVEVANLDELSALLDGMTSAQAAGYGIAPGHPDARIVPDERVPDDAAAISRSRCFFQFAPRPGVMMLDHDGHPDGSLDPDALRAMLVEAVPELADVPMLWRASASSGIETCDGDALTGINGQRLYVAVSDASCIPDAGRALATRLWAAGIGWFNVSRAGSLLARTIVDTSVWQPERLDFAGPPVLGEGLRRAPPPARVMGPADAVPFDLRRIQADGEHRAAAVKYEAQQREAVAAAARTQREAWIEAEAPKLAAARDIDIEQAREVLAHATSRHLLMGDFVLVTADGNEVTVGEVLDNPARWHGARFADPLEPEYAGDCRIAWANLRGGGKPFIYSHAHGGQRFTLARPARRVLLATGDRARIVDNVLAALRAEGEVFDFGEGAGGIARVAGGNVIPVSRDWLLDFIDRTVSFYKMRKAGDTFVEAPADAPATLAASILAKGGERGFRRLVAVTTAPTLRADGSVLDEPGHDEASGLLYLAGLEAPRVPRAPSAADAVDALRVLWEPVRLFPFGDDTDRGVMLAAMLTACLRASLPTAPGFAFDAPAAGSGKTLLGKVLGILATGESPAVLPPAGERDDEARKRLFAALRDGRRVLLWDNVREPLGGAAIDAFLTAPTFADRVLGVSETAVLPNRALFVATGNNLRLVGDTCRRVLVARIDPQDERPYGRRFAFDPEQTVRGQRVRLVVAALTIIRAWVAAGRPRLAAGSMASFEQWDELVRQPVLWVASEAARRDAALPGFVDPADAIVRAFANDPETAKLAAMLATWDACFGTRPTAVKDAIRHSALSGTDAAAQALADAIDEVAGERGQANSRILGRWVERQVGRRHGGRWFVAGRMRDGYKTWAIEREPRRPAETDPLKPTEPTESRTTRDGARAARLDSVGLVDESGFPAANGGGHVAVPADAGPAAEVF